MKEKLKQIFSEYGFKLNEKQLDQFEKYYKYLIEENMKFNLTAITEENDVIIKHFLDSVLPIQEIKPNSTLIDVGTGAGFPGLPIKIMRPDIKMVLLDSLQKRINFLNETIKLLGLDKIEAVHARAEDYAIKNRESFDYATSRAVAQTNTLVEYMLPFVKVGGKAVLYKSSKIEDELKAAQNAITTLGGSMPIVLSFKIKESEIERKIVIIRKEKRTNEKYPRNKNLPKIKPIM